MQQALIHQLFLALPRNLVFSGEVPHLLLHGPPGTGKTTTAQCLLKELFGPNYRRHAFEMNASQDRGLAAVQEKLKSFARGAVQSEKDRDG